MKMVYVVTEGMYSDYTIMGVFDNLAWAEELVDRINDDAPSSYSEARVERYPLNNFAPGRDFWEVRMLRDGTTVSVGRISVDYISGFDCWLSNGQLMVECWADDEQHAVKIANEWRAQLIAADAWEDI